MDQEEDGETFREKYLASAPGDDEMKAYLANKYLGGGDEETTVKKKKKKKAKKIKSGNIGIIDEDNLGWKTEHEEELERKKERRRQELELLRAEAATNANQMFRGHTDGWETIQQKEPDDRQQSISVGGADKLKKKGYSAVNDEEEEEEEDRPVIVSDLNQGEVGGRLKMSDGKKSGLLTAAEIRAEAARAREEKKKAMKQLEKEGIAQEAETVYRDESGRKIDPKVKRAEEARKRKEEIEKQERRMEWGKGLVQRKEADEMKKRLEEEKFKPLARYADDEEYVQERKSRELWNDPAAGFLTRKTSAGQEKGPRRPEYKGPSKPNRFMIRPGFRWDGVDRSNGFEDKLLLRQNQIRSNTAEAHQWATEDM